ncbi:MAG: hypothetical protein JJ913_13515 [Rhizobiaceae bacterium]|nr:hypothetical protein [Rhizobiaceae bacterium]
MRYIFATILMAILASSAANASSIVVLPAHEGPASPSIVTLGNSSPSVVAAREPETTEWPSVERFGGEQQRERRFVNVSASVIAMVDAPQPVAFENVASISDDEAANQRARDAMPMVIRGGIVGDAFVSRSAPATVTSERPQREQQVSAPPPPRDEGSSRPQPRDPGPQAPQPQPKSALPPPAPPTGRME